MKKLPGLLLALSLPLTLSACQTQADSTADRPFMMYYNPDYNNTGIINTAGVMIAPPDNTEKTILYQDDQQAYLYVKESTYDKENRNEWNEPTCTGAEFRFYTPDGSLVRTVSMQDKGEVIYYPGREDPLQGVFLCNNITMQNTVEVLNADGTAIITLQPEQRADYGYADLTMCDNWLWLSAHFYGNNDYQNSPIYSDAAIYTKDGTPMETAQDYTNVWRIYDYKAGYDSTAYFQAYYETSDGHTVSDIIDENATVMLSGITDCNHYQDGLLIVEKDGKRGLIDIEGNWLYYETPNGDTMTADPAPDSDQVLEVMNFYGYNGTGIINTEGQMILPTDDLGKFMVTGEDGSTQYLYTITNHFDPENINRWGSPRLTGAEYDFYTTTGELIQKVDLRNKGEIDFRAGDTPDDCFFLCNTAELGGDLEVIRGDGSTVLTLPLNIPDDNSNINSYAHLTVFDNWLGIDYNCTDFTNGSYNTLAHGNAYYTLDGQPMTFTQDYSSIWEIWDFNGYTSEASGYYQASYTNSQGKYLLDILDAADNTVLTGLSMVGSYHDGLLICERGSERGLIDMQGNWLYRESIFNALDD